MNGNAGAYSGYSLHAQGDEGIQIILSHPGLPCSRVTRLSPTAVWALPEEKTRLPLRERSLPVLLDGPGGTIGPLRGEPIWCDPKQRGAPFGLQLVGVSVEQGQRILRLLDEAVRNGRAEPAASPLPIQEAILERERIRSVMAALAASGHKGVLRRPGQTVRVVLEHFDDESSQLYWRCDEPGAELGEPPYDVELVGYNSAYRMRLEGPGPQGERMVTPLPRRLWRVRHRWHRRVPAPPGLRARFFHPVWLELGPREREAVDVSFSGLCLRSAQDDLVFPGLILEPLELTVDGGEPIRLRGEVRHVSQTRSDGQRVCGLEVTACTPADEARWMHLVSGALCPRTRSGGEMLESMWELFIDSGYFNLAGKSEAHFEELHESFLELGRRAAHMPRLFCQTVWPSERGVEATLSLARPYRYSWLVHQLAKRPGTPANALVPGQVLRDTYMRTLEHAQADPDFRWMVAYLETSVPFLHRAHVRFGHRLAGTGQALVMPLRMMDAYCHEESGLPAEGLDIGPATDEEKALLVVELYRTRPACYVEALDFVRDRLDLGEAAAPWRGAGLERERHILVARRAERPIAAAVLELGHPGANLFRLLDTARLFPLTPDGEEAYVALLDAARRWYARKGRGSFLFLREDDDSMHGDGASLIEAARLHDEPAAQPCLWILAAEHLPEFLEHISEMTIGHVSSTGQSA